MKRNRSVPIITTIKSADSIAASRSTGRFFFWQLHLVFWLFVGLMLIMTSKYAEGKAYRIGVNDELHISVWDEPDLDKQVTVLNDGTILFPLIGRIQVKGLTVLKLTMNITGLLDKDYVVDPQVTVKITEYNSQNIYILGHVSKPGLYSLKGETNVLKAIAMAGGVAPQAGEKLQLLKLSGKDIHQGKKVENLLKKNKFKEVSLNALLKLGDLSQNLPVEADDVIFIPAADEVADLSVYVTGEIRKPGSYAFKEGITALMLCITAGGFTAVSAPNRAEIIRTTKEGNQQVINIDLEDISDGKIKDIVLFPGDRIIIPERYI